MATEVWLKRSTLVIEAELKQLCKGHGVWSDDLERPQRLGPELRRLCGIVRQDNEAASRQKLARRLGAIAARLPAEIRTVALVALAMQTGTRDMRYLARRIKWLQAEHGYAERTARRRIDEALKHLAAEAAQGLVHGTPPLDPDEGWYVELLRTRLSMDRPAPQAVEERRIVATMDGLAEIIHRVNLPCHRLGANTEQPLELDVLFGGTLRPRQATGRHFSYAVSLPSRLNIGDRHEYQVVARIPDGQAMAPQYVCVPLRRHDEFELIIQFPPDRPPATVWRVDAVAPRVIDDRVVTEPLLVPDRFGVVHTHFRDLRVGFGYGVQWKT